MSEEIVKKMTYLSSGKTRINQSSPIIITLLMYSGLSLGNILSDLSVTHFYRLAIVCSQLFNRVY